MKWQYRLIFALLAIVLLFVGRETIDIYLSTHQYYFGKTAGAIGFFERGANWKLIIWGVVYSLIPLGYLWFTDKASPLKLGIAVYLALFLFGLSHMGHRGQLSGGSGTVVFALSMLIFQGLATYFIMFVKALGTVINDFTFKLSTADWPGTLLIRGLGLGVHLLINHFLILLGLYHPIITRLYFIAGAGLIWWKRGAFRQVGDLFRNAVRTWKSSGWMKYVFWGLLIMSLLYIMYGLQLSFVPYPTAWDANHAYMLYPKIFALNHGYPWTGGVSPSPLLWLSYISFWFSLIIPFGDSLWISPDSVAVVMNFLSGIFVLIFGVVATKELLSIIKPRRSELHDESQDADLHLHEIPSDKRLFMGLGRFGILLWLTSGMGAFLVFVDNKTDLGVLSLVLLALLSGFTMIKHLMADEMRTHRYVYLSALFFALAALAKPTAFVDIFTFVLFFAGIFVGVGAVVGLILIGLGGVAKIGILNTKNMLHEDSSLFLMGLGVLGLLPETILGLFRNSKKYLLALLLWGVTLVATIVLVKSPHILYKYFNAPEPVPASDLFKRYLMGSVGGERTIDSRTLVATTASPIEVVAPEGLTIESVTVVEPAAPTTDALPFSQCSLASVGASSVDELYERLKEIQGGGLIENVGRYVGFGQKKFVKFTREQRKNKSTQSTNGLGIGYGLLNLVYPKNDHCYTRNDLAKYLCESRATIATMSVDTLTSMLGVYSSPGADDYLQNLVDGIASGSLFATDIPTMLNNYWQQRVVLSDATSISVPYRYLIPFNIVNNRSLQNESSYYTDIGFIWLISLVLLILGLIFAIIVRDKKILALSLATLGGRVLWIVIGGGIVWYGLGLVIWLVFSNVVFLYRLTIHFPEYSLGRYLSYTTVGIFTLLGLFQRTLNMTRISTQGGGGAFVAYKQYKGYTQPVVLGANGSITQPATLTDKFSRKTVFDLQFGHYDPLLSLLEDRDDEDGVYVAGTYAQYFFENQKNVLYDGMVGRMGLHISDEDECSTYLRLLDNNIRYVVMDPNIATVVQGNGNSSLFHRFLVKTDAAGRRLSNGVMAMLAEMSMAGYMELKHSSNLGIAYAYTLSSAELAPYMSQVGETDEVLFRTKLAGSRFFRADAGKYQNVVASIFTSRIQNGLVIQDLADITGKDIDVDSVKTTAALASQQSTQFATSFEALTQDEKFITLQYINFLNAVSDQTKLQSLVQQILTQSLSSGSQIAVWKLN